MAGTGPWAAQSNIEPIAAVTIQAIANSALYNVVSGCAGTYSGAAMTLTIAVGSITHNGTVHAVAGNDVTLVADPSNPRWTYTYIASNGTASIVSGSAAATPAVPDPGANVTAQLTYVQAALTIASNATYKLDKRVTAVATYQSPAYASMVQLGGGALTAPTTITQTGRVMLCDFNASAISISGSTDVTDSSFSIAFAAVGGLQPYTTKAADGTVSDSLGVAIGNSRVLTLTGPSVAGAFGLLTGYQGSFTATTAVAVLSPARSPWMRVKMNPSSGGATNITSRLFGFFDSAAHSSVATASGAYLRRNTTGNLFFVTRQGGSETAVDLGAQTAAERWYDVYSPDAGVTWYYYDHTAAAGGNQATNVPTAGTDLIVGHVEDQATLNQTSALSRIAVSYIDN